MSDGCIFCSIVDGDVPSRTVYEDEDTLAFLDVNPLAPGHTVVIPRTHRERLEDLSAEEASAVFATLNRVVPAAQAAVDAPATTVAFNNGTAAGQEVPHVHGHVVPRFEDDGARAVHDLFDERPDLSDEELDEIAGQIATETA